MVGRRPHRPRVSRRAKVAGKDASLAHAAAAPAAWDNDNLSDSTAPLNRPVVLLLQQIARYRSTLDIPLAEAGALAAETCGGPRVLEAQRLVYLMDNAMSGSEERARTAREISEALLLRAGILARAA